MIAILPPMKYMYQMKNKPAYNNPDGMLLAVHRWPTGGSASGPLEICPSDSPEDRRWQPP